MMYEKVALIPNDSHKSFYGKAYMMQNKMVFTASVIKPRFA